MDLIGNFGSGRAIFKSLSKTLPGEKEIITKMSGRILTLHAWNIILNFLVETQVLELLYRDDIRHMKCNASWIHLIYDVITERNCPLLDYGTVTKQ
jgi:hypothetical protein